MTARIDPPKYSGAEDRCTHDQLILNGRSTCSICRGLPDVPEMEAVFATGELADVPMRWDVVVETRVDCVRCGHVLQLGRRATYSVAEGGVIGECCEAVA